MGWRLGFRGGGRGLRMLGFSNFSAQGVDLDFGLRGKDAGLVLGWIGLRILGLVSG